MKKNIRKGFTLVELLIVIVVIGILSAMMMMSSSEAVSSARVTTIIGNLRNLKTAALAYYNDNMDAIEARNDSTGKLDADYTKILAYLNGKDQMPDKGDYWLHNIQSNGNAANGGWWVVYNVNALKGSEATRIKEKLAGRAKSLGLVKATGNYDTIYESGNDNVAIQVR